MEGGKDERIDRWIEKGRRIDTIKRGKSYNVILIFLYIPYNMFLK